MKQQTTITWTTGNGTEIIVNVGIEMLEPVTVMGRVWNRGAVKTTCTVYGERAMLNTLLKPRYAGSIKVVAVINTVKDQCGVTEANMARIEAAQKALMSDPAVIELNEYKQAARKYNAANNEGGYGYNPYDC